MNKKEELRNEVNKMLEDIGYKSPIKDKPKPLPPMGIINYYDKFSSTKIEL